MMFDFNGSAKHLSFDEQLLVWKFIEGIHAAKKGKAAAHQKSLDMLHPSPFSRSQFDDSKTRPVLGDK